MENEARGLLSMPGVGFFGMLVIGILAGYIAEKATASDHGLLTNLLVGIAGSFVGGWIASTWLHRPVAKDFFDLATWVSAIGGALVLLIAYRLLFGNSRD